MIIGRIREFSKNGERKKLMGQNLQWEIFCLFIELMK